MRKSGLLDFLNIIKLVPHNFMNREWKHTVKSIRVIKHYELISCFKLLCLIGESFEEYSEDICGAVVNIRNKGDKLSLWTKEAGRPDAILKIGYVISCSELKF